MTPAPPVPEIEQTTPPAALTEAAARVERTSSLEGGRIPSLDGLRAISIAMVLGAHAINAVVRPRLGHDYEGKWNILFNGGLGVSTFFTISGFLITLLLLRELKKTGRIELVDFYIRRAFRIWPAFYFYIATIVVLAKLGYLAIGRKDILAACFFVFNYAHVGNWWVAHTWSLSIEEQFYFFWPALLVLLGRRNGAFAAVALILLEPVVRTIEVATQSPHSWLVQNMWQTGHTRLDSLMFGCAIALAWGEHRFQRAMSVAFKIGLPFVALIYLFILAPLAPDLHWKYFQSALGYTLDSVCISLLIVWCVQRAGSVPGKLLNSPVAVHIGLISYSLYLWQQLFLVQLNHTWTGRFPANILCALVMAELSFFLIERPFLRLRSALVFRTHPKS